MKMVKLFLWFKIYINTWQNLPDIFLSLDISLRNEQLQVEMQFACVYLCIIIKSCGIHHASNTEDSGFVQTEVIELLCHLFFQTLPDITTGFLQDDKYQMNHFNVNYIVAEIHEKILAWWAMKEVKISLNAAPKYLPKKRGHGRTILIQLSLKLNQKFG